MAKAEYEARGLRFVDVTLMREVAVMVTTEHGLWLVSSMTWLGPRLRL